MNYQSRTSVIKRKVAAAFGVSVRNLDSDRRPSYIAIPRQVAMYIVSQLTEMSTTAIGVHFHRDHTTVMHAIRRTEGRMKADPEFRDLVNGLCHDLAAPDIEEEILRESIVDRAAAEYRRFLRDLERQPPAQLLETLHGIRVKRGGHD